MKPLLGAAAGVAFAKFSPIKTGMGSFADAAALALGAKFLFRQSWLNSAAVGAGVLAAPMVPIGGSGGSIGGYTKN